MDPSYNNWGLAFGVLDTVSGTLSIESLDVIKAEKITAKQVRQNHKDIEVSHQLSKAATEAAEGVHAIFVEVPHGSQSARSSATYGVCVGVLGAMRAAGIQFFEVSALEVKLAGAGNKTATKVEMMDWAQQAHPELVYPTRLQEGVICRIASKAEHMADAVGAIHAGLKLDSFKQLMQLRA
jgi:Holliday junction resolvasome RuvABC endonuclease subunit